MVENNLRKNQKKDNTRNVEILFWTIIEQQARNLASVVIPILHPKFISYTRHLQFHTLEFGMLINKCLSNSNINI